MKHASYATHTRVRNKTCASVIYFAHLRLVVYFEAYHANVIIFLFVSTVNKVGSPNRYDREESCETSIGTNRFAILSRWKARSVAASRATFLLSLVLLQTKSM